MRQLAGYHLCKACHDQTLAALPLQTLFHHPNSNDAPR